MSRRSLAVAALIFLAPLPSQAQVAPALPALPPLPGDEAKKPAVKPSKQGKAEHATVRKVFDPQQRGMLAYAFSAPASWKDQGKVIWDLQNITTPARFMFSAENPANEEAFYFYPAVELFTIRPDGGFFHNGQVVGGMMKSTPMDPLRTLLGFVQQARGGYPDFNVVGGQNVLDLPKMLKANLATNQTGIAVKVTYTLQGKPVEEEFYSIYYSQDIPYDGPRGRTWQVNFGLGALHSFRGPAGSLDKRRGTFIEIMKSLHQNPAWSARVAATSQYLGAQYDAQLKAGYDRIAAAGRLSKQISANSDAFLANVDRQLQSSKTSAPAPEARSETDHFDDYIRGVDTVNDPGTGSTSQHSNANQYHWTDGNGSYRNSNDTSYNPNQSENGSWQLMEAAP